MNSLKPGLVSVALGLVCQTAGAEDLFIDAQPREIVQGTVLASDTTIGGYAIYPGEGKWTFIGSKSHVITGPMTAWHGSATLIHYEARETFAIMRLYTDIRPAATSAGWRGAPCDSGALVIVNKGQGRFDNCMTIKANGQKIGNRDATLLQVQITVNGTNARYYGLNLSLNPELLGFRGTAPGDWAPGAMARTPAMDAFMDRLRQWAVKLHDATSIAFTADKPADAFKDVESWRTLLPVPADLAGKGFSQSFLSAVFDTSNKPDHKAIAYTRFGSNGTRWGNTWSMPTPKEAGERAVVECEKGRTSAMPDPCRLYPLNRP